MRPLSFFFLYLSGIAKKGNLNRIISRPSLNPVQSLLRHRLAIRAQRSLFTALYIIFSISLYIRWHKPRASVRGDRPPRATCAYNLLSLISFSNGRYSWTGIEPYSDACHADAFARGCVCISKIAGTKYITLRCVLNRSRNIFIHVQFNRTNFA